jgi:putative addiction module component (TIGR02574 family)
MKNELVAEILALPLEERVQLVEAIWDSISAFPEALPLTGWQKDELDRRLAEYESDPDAGSSLEEVLARVRRAS